MANEKEANQARAQHSDLLRDLGAHGITIDEVNRKGEKTFAVIAFFEQKPDKLPGELEVKIGKKTVTVPLVGRVMEGSNPNKRR